MRRQNANLILFMALDLLPTLLSGFFSYLTLTEINWIKRKETLNPPVLHILTTNLGINFLKLVYT